MKFPLGLGSLRRGAKIVSRFVTGKLARPHVGPAPPPLGSRLVALESFGDNPGRLRMLAHLTPSVTGRPLVVLLHGCGQAAAAFAMDSGWAELADRLQFALLLPEQAKANNASRCFQWFHPASTARDKGEAASIAAMVRAATSQFGSDPKRVFIVGLSAGGAMAVAMLASYPDLFAAGATVAGLPVGAARSGMQAILRMASAGPDRTSDEWADQARAAAPAGFHGPWPRLSIWQGEADMTVAPANATLLATQWRALHGLNTPALMEQASHGVRHRVWPDGLHPLVESWSLPDFPHAYPVGARVAVPGRFVEQAQVDATSGIARFFGLESPGAPGRG